MLATRAVDRRWSGTQRQVLMVVAELFCRLVGGRSWSATTSFVVAVTC